MRKKIILTSFLWLIILVPLIFEIYLVSAIASSPPSEDRQKRIKEIESKLSDEEQKLKAFDSQEKDLLAQLAHLEQEVAEARLSVHKVKESIRLEKIEMEKLKSRLANSERRLQDVETQVAKRLAALYKYARKGYVKILTDARDLGQFWQRVMYLKVIMKEDQLILEKLTQQKRKEEKQVARIKQELDQKQLSYEGNKIRLSSLEKDLEKKVIRLMKVHKEKEFYETAVKELQVAAKNLKQTISNIEKKDNHLNSMLSRFEDSKGQLPFPLEGKVIKAEKLSASRSRYLHKGIFIECDSGAEVKAVFPGRVDFSGKLKGYGEVIIINHGSRFFTISAHFSHRIKEKGDLVEAGEVIGFVGPNGSSKAARLYFEIRRAGASLDPLSWLRVH